MLVMAIEGASKSNFDLRVIVMRHCVNALPSLMVIGSLR